MLLGNVLPLFYLTSCPWEMGDWSAPRNWEELQTMGQVTVQWAASWFPSKRLNSPPLNVLQVCRAVRWPGLVVCS